MSRTFIFGLLSVAVLVGGCTPRIGGQDYSVSDSGYMSQRWTGVILSMRPVTISNQKPGDQGKPGAGTVVGGVTGAVAGSAIGKGHGSLAVGALGAVAGGVAGHFVEKELSRQQGFEYEVRLDDGRTISLAQGAEPKLSVGQTVLVIKGKERTRVVPA